VAACLIVLVNVAENAPDYGCVSFVMLRETLAWKSVMAAYASITLTTSVPTRTVEQDL